MTIMIETQKEFVTDSGNDIEKGLAVTVASLALLSACVTAYFFTGFWIHGGRA
jgi:hypothetical protein